jgi:phage head maturation protease
MTSIDRGDIKESSYGFTVAVDQWDFSDPKVTRREIIEIEEIFDVSPVVFAAFNDTSVALRKMEEVRKTSGPLAGDGGTPDPLIGLGHLAAEEEELKLKIHE